MAVIVPVEVFPSFMIQVERVNHAKGRDHSALSAGVADVNIYYVPVAVYTEEQRLSKNTSHTQLWPPHSYGQSIVTVGGLMHDCVDQVSTMKDWATVLVFVRFS